MNKPSDKSATPVAGAHQTERERRLAQALRDNLRRRKTQARAKADAEEATPVAPRADDDQRGG